MKKWPLYILYLVWSFPVKSFSIQILSRKKKKKKSESRLAVDAAVDNCNDSGRNWKQSILSTITSLLAHWGPGGADKWEIWETTASCESISDCRYRPFRSTRSLSSPSLPVLLLLLLFHLATDKRTDMQSYSGTYCLSCVSAAAKFIDSELPDVWPSAYLLLSDSSESNQHTQEELSFMHWRHCSASQVRCSSLLLLISFIWVAVPLIWSHFWSRRRTSWKKKKKKKQ